MSRAAHVAEVLIQVAPDLHFEVEEQFHAELSLQTEVPFEILDYANDDGKLLSKAVL